MLFHSNFQGQFQQHRAFQQGRNIPQFGPKHGLNCMDQPGQWPATLQLGQMVACHKISYFRPMHCPTLPHWLPSTFWNWLFSKWGLWQYLCRQSIWSLCHYHQLHQIDQSHSDLHQSMTCNHTPHSQSLIQTVWKHWQSWNFAPLLSSLSSFVPTRFSNWNPSWLYPKSKSSSLGPTMLCLTTCLQTKSVSVEPRTVETRCTSLRMMNAAPAVQQNQWLDGHHLSWRKPVLRRCVFCNTVVLRAMHNCSTPFPCRLFSGGHSFETNFQIWFSHFSSTGQSMVVLKQWECRNWPRQQMIPLSHCSRPVILEPWGPLFFLIAAATAWFQVFHATQCRQNQRTAICWCPTTVCIWTDCAARWNSE